MRGVRFGALLDGTQRFEGRAHQLCGVGANVQSGVGVDPAEVGVNGQVAVVKRLGGQLWLAAVNPAINGSAGDEEHAAFAVVGA